MAPPRRYRGKSAQRAQRQAGGNSEENDWLATYGDLMSLLLVFFVLFYIFSITGQMPLLSDALQAYQDDTKRATEIPEDMDIAPKDTGREMVISIPSQVLFDLGKADLKPAAIPYLEEAVNDLTTILSEQPDAQVRIEGYTDNIPIHNWRFRDNWELSAARSISVVKFLIEEKQFDPMRLQAMGYGEYNPVVPNDSPENRQKNRRVEIKVINGLHLKQPEESPEVKTETTEKEAREAARKLIGKGNEE